jgi:maltokinase
MKPPRRRRAKVQPPAPVVEPPAEGAVEPAAAPTPATAASLAGWAREQRWFARPADEGDAAGDAPPAPPHLDRHPFPGGYPDIGVLTLGADRYQLVLDPKPNAATAGDLAADEVAATTIVRGVLASPPATDADPIEVGIRARSVPGGAPLGTAAARPLGTEQSNTSVSVGGTHVVKVLRRLRAGIHPEVEIGRHLASVADRHPDLSLPVARLAGWWDLAGAADGTSATVCGVVHEAVSGGLDGWSLTLSAVAADPGGALHRLRDLGVAVAVLHQALAEPAAGSDAFGTVPFGGGDARAVATALAAELHDLSATAPVEHGVRAALAADASRYADLATTLAASVDDGISGAAIRTHGDLHLGQTLVGGRGWVILDFEGEPTRSLDERRRHHSPLRDLAGLLRSLSYAAETVRRASGDVRPGGWEAAARAAVLDGYLATIDPELIPVSAATTRNLLTLFELEKAVYEVRYELAHRPDWVDLPLAGLARLAQGAAR